MGTFDQIQPEYLQPADALSAFSGGKVDAWSIWDPYTAQAQAQTGARILVYGNGFGTNYNFNVAADKALKDKAKVAAIRDYLARDRQGARMPDKPPATPVAFESGVKVPRPVVYIDDLDGRVDLGGRFL